MCVVPLTRAVMMMDVLKVINVLLEFTELNLHVGFLLINCLFI